MRPGFRFRLLLVRHGEAHGNQRGAFLGRDDAPLTERGREQVLTLRRRWGDIAIDRAYASPLRRARETAELLLADRTIEPAIDGRLVEQDYGSWDGLTFPEAKRHFPQDFNLWRRGDPRVAPTGGEPLLDVAERMGLFFKDLEDAAPQGAALLLVGHAGALQTLLCRMFGVTLRNLWPFRLQPASLTEIELYDSGPSMTRMSWR